MCGIGGSLLTRYVEAQKSLEDTGINGNLSNSSNGKLSTHVAVISQI